MPERANISMKNFRVVLADDHPFVILGLRAALGAHADIEIVGEATSLAAVFDLLKTVRCDVLVTDLMMPVTPDSTCDALGYIRNVRFHWPALRIIAITALTNPPILQPIMSLGIDGIIGKGESLADLANIVRTSTRIDPHRGAMLRDMPGGFIECGNEAVCDLHPIRVRLSKRETQVLRLIIEGHSVDDIAVILGRNARTIKRQKRSAMAKIGVSNDPGLFAFVRAYGLP
jgi:two-component system, NarL family, captular synthesis response regulator RcsB